MSYKVGLFAAALGVAMVMMSISNVMNRNMPIAVDSLRTIYARPSSEWPRANVDEDIEFRELGVLPESPLMAKKDSLKSVIALGKTLFFDPRVSGSNQISCSSCHVPDLNWSDGRRVAIGHDHNPGARNTPTIENIWFYNRFFWDGRSSSLEDQAVSPITSDVEMHQDMKLLPKELRRIKGYRPMFAEAFGDDKISEERILKALATYQLTVTSRKTEFDLFLLGDHKRMTDEQLWGLHLFRTKARCINCHSGPLLTDGGFHNLGLTYYGRKYQDLGLYNVTKKAEDVGKFKTPGLRDVIRTRPWFHNGLFDNIEGVLNMYSAGMPQPKPNEEQLSDPLFPKTSKHIKKLDLSKAEKEAIISFLNALTTVPLRVEAPAMPK